jgi:hypothetical protein
MRWIRTRASSWSRATFSALKARQQAYRIADSILHPHLPLPRRTLPASSRLHAEYEPLSEQEFYLQELDRDYARRSFWADVVCLIIAVAFVAGCMAALLYSVSSH